MLEIHRVCSGGNTVMKTSKKLSTIASILTLSSFACAPSVREDITLEIDESAFQLKTTPHTPQALCQEESPIPRAAQGSVNLNSNQFIVCGGYDGIYAVTNICQKFDATTKSWTRIANMRATRSYHHMATLPDGRVLAIGGYMQDANWNSWSLSGVEVYDPLRDRWTSSFPLNTARYIYPGSSTSFPSGEPVIFAGGGNNATGEVMNLQTFKWTQFNLLTTHNDGHVAVQHGNSVILTGGGSSNKVERYTLSNGTVTGTALPDMSGNRRNHVAFTVRVPAGATWATPGHTVLVLASGDRGGGAPVSEFLDLDETATGWQPLGDMIEPSRSHALAVKLHGTPIVVGGYYKSAERFNTTTGQWVEVAKPLAEWHGEFSLNAAGNLIVAYGGWGYANFGAEYGENLIASNGGRWLNHADPNKPGPFTGAYTADLGGGKVLVAGGFNLDYPLSGIFVLDVTQGCSWKRVADLGVPRSDIAGVRLPSGQFALIGGRLTGYTWEGIGRTGVIETLNLTTGAVTERGNIGAEISGAKAILPFREFGDDTIYVVGGMVEGGPHYSKIEITDLDATEANPNLRGFGGRDFFYSAIFDTFLWFASGEMAELLADSNAGGYLYDPTTEDWFALTGGFVPIDGASMTELSDGSVFFAGIGSTIDTRLLEEYRMINGTTYPSAGRYDTRNDRWQRLADMPERTSLPVSMELGQYVYAIGGGRGGTYSEQAKLREAQIMEYSAGNEVTDPEGSRLIQRLNRRTNQWEITGELAAPMRAARVQAVSGLPVGARLILGASSDENLGLLDQVIIITE